MDRISKSLLEEFATEHGLEKLPEDKQFEHFAAFLAVTSHAVETIDTDDIVTGRGADTGVDAIAVLANGVLLTDVEQLDELVETNGYVDATFIFVQADRGAGFETAKIGQIGFGVLDFFSDNPKLPRNTSVTAAASIMAAVYKLSSKFKRGNPTCRIYYVTTGKWTGDANLDARRTTVVSDLKNLGIFREVDFIPLGADRVQKLYAQTKNAISREFTFTERTVIPEIPGVTEAYLGIIPAKEFLQLVQDDSGEIIRTIFYDNVRDWQDYNVVNSGIRATLASPEARRRFVLMNNGITVIAKTVRSTGHKLYIEDYQIVNGCQTSHVLWYNRQDIDDSVMIPLRLIATQDEDVIASIIKATNRQTEVREEQLLALSDFQKKLELFFKSYEEPRQLFYERRSRQYSGTTVEKARIVLPGNLIRAYASMFLDEPHRTTRNFRTLLDRVGDTIFGDSHRLEPYYTAAFAYYRLEYLFRNQLLGAKYKPARFHILLAARMLANVNKPPPPNANAMQKYCETILEHLWNPAEAEELFAKAADLVDGVAQGNFDRDHIRTQPFTESLMKACASI
ncbi:MAG: AIPR family protein [Acidobacteriota bacterium]|nr:AIPR family protein [Acidobacteriota bacterium]